MLTELTHAVRWRYKYATRGAGWHTMAAFDNEQAANSYMRACRYNGDREHLEYRVIPVRQDEPKRYDDVTVSEPTTRPFKHVHNWCPVNDLVDRCSVCGEERA